MDSKVNYFILTLLVPLSYFITSSYLPVWLERISPSAVGPAISVYFVGQIIAVFLLIFIKVPKALAPAALIIVGLSLISLLTLSEQIILISRLLGGFFFGLYGVMITKFSIVLAKGTKSFGRFYSIANFFNALPAVVGPVLSSLVFYAVGISMVFVVAATAFFICAILTLPLLKITEADATALRLGELKQTLATNYSVYIAYFLEMFFFMYWLVLVPIRINQFGAAGSIGLVFGVEAAIYTVMQLVNARIIDFTKKYFLTFLFTYFALDVAITLVPTFGLLVATSLLVAVVSFPLTPVLYARNAEGTEKGLEQASSALMTLSLRLGWSFGSIAAASIFLLL